MGKFVKAKSEQAFLKLALYGKPGSGKTLTSLLWGEGLAARVLRSALIQGNCCGLLQGQRL
jgi:hypothetical protein